jgi:hypothetical protein
VKCGVALHSLLEIALPPPPPWDRFPNVRLGYGVSALSLELVEVVVPHSDFNFRGREA